MRDRVDAERLRRFMRVLGARVRSVARVYLTGGSSAVLLEWRASTIDVDVKFEPEADDILRAIPDLKERLSINVELASPGDFIPELPGWRDRSPFIAAEGPLTFHHYDFYSQALAKIERSHARDVEDVMQMANRKLIEPRRMVALFEQIEPHLYRYPALNGAAFRSRVEQTVRKLQQPT